MRVDKGLDERADEEQDAYALLYCANVDLVVV